MLSYQLHIIIISYLYNCTLIRFRYYLTHRIIGIILYIVFNENVGITHEITNIEYRLVSWVVYYFKKNPLELIPHI